MTLTLSAQGRYDIRWQRVLMDGSRTGCTIPDEDNVTESLGSVKGGTYTAPNGLRYKGGCTPKVAAEVIAAQPSMASVKRFIGISPRALYRNKVESELSDLFTDRLLVAARRLFPDRKIDVSIGNFGGIRTDLPEGRIVADNFVSMFPFENRITYVRITGARLREIFRQFASENLEPFGGARMTVRGGEIVSLEVGGKPIDDSAEYGVATIDFLLTGGDNLYLEKDAIEIIKSDVLELTAILEYVDSLSAAGAPITYHTDGRMTVLDTEKQEDAE